MSSLYSSYDCPRSAGLEPIGLDNITMSDSANGDDPIVGSLVGSVSLSKGQQLDSTRSKNPLSSALTSTQISKTHDAITTANFTKVQLSTFSENKQSKHEAGLMMQESKKLQEKCLRYMNREKELVQKVTLLKKELEEERNKYGRMLSELPKLRTV